MGVGVSGMEVPCVSSVDVRSITLDGREGQHRTLYNMYSAVLQYRWVVHSNEV